MTDRPILFSAPMIRAILDGRKTQTRRVLKPQPTPGLVRECILAATDIPNTSGYAPGDRLWVKEALRFERCFDDFSPGNLPIGEIIARQYEADGARKFWKYDHLPVGRLRTSIHMPRRFSRLTLTITDVRIERLQDISEADAMAEGVSGTDWGHGRDYGGPAHYRPCFRALWDSLNAARGYGWEANPWVAAITFTASRRNIDAEAAP